MPNSNTTQPRYLTSADLVHRDIERDEATGDRGPWHCVGQPEPGVVSRQPAEQCHADASDGEAPERRSRRQSRKGRLNEDSDSLDDLTAAISTLARAHRRAPKLGRGTNAGPAPAAAGALEGLEAERALLGLFFFPSFFPAMTGYGTLWWMGLGGVGVVQHRLGRAKCGARASTTTGWKRGVATIGLSC